MPPEHHVDPHTGERMGSPHAGTWPDRLAGHHMPELPPLPPSPWETLAMEEPAIHTKPSGTSAGGPARPPGSAEVRKARAHMAQALQAALAGLEALMAANKDPAAAKIPVTKLDRRLAPLLIASENWRTPGLNLIALHTDTAEESGFAEYPLMKGSWNIQAFIESAGSGRYLALLDNGQHTRAAHILKNGPEVSVLVVDSLRIEKSEESYEDYAMALREDCGPGTRLAFIPIDVQKSAHGCRIFSLSLALKMHARADMFMPMHEALSGAGDLGPSVPQMRHTEDEDAFVILQPGPLVDAGMMKHAESRTAIRRYLLDHPEQGNVAVNKRHETLAERMERHRVTRTVMEKNQPKQVTFSNSIEHKRIALLRRALEYVHAAPADHVARLAPLLR